MANYTGSCLCGKITYKVNQPLRDVQYCHCTQCRKTTGHFVAATQASTENMEINGEVSWYQSSNFARRGFCNTCGSNLFWQPGNRKETSIWAGSLDGDTGLKVTSQIHVESKGDYYPTPDVKIVEQSPKETYFD